MLCLSSWEDECIAYSHYHQIILEVQSTDYGDFCWIYNGHMIVQKNTYIDTRHSVAGLCGSHLQFFYAMLSQPSTKD